MEAENKLYADMHGDRQGQIAASQQQHQQLQQPDPSQGHPVDTSNMAGMPYYAPPSGMGYGGRYGAPPSGPMPQHQQMTETQRSVTRAIRYSCFVTWICCFPLGVAAYMLATQARDAVARDPQGARKLVRQSYVFSTFGVVVGIGIVALVFGLLFGFVICTDYSVDGECYSFKSSVNSRADCSEIDGVFRDGYCYFN